MLVLPEPLVWELAGGDAVRLAPVAATSSLAAPIATWFDEMALRLGLDAHRASDGVTVAFELVDAARRPAGLPATIGVDPAGGPPGSDWYEVAVGPAAVVVRAQGDAGLARGAATLLQLLATEPTGAVPAGRIADAPALAWRGLSFDVARQYYDVVDLHRLIDLLALYRCNALQLHLTDDQGWRLAAGRPDAEATAAAPGDDDRWYTDEELQGLDAHAAALGITIIPEIDVPGHTAALLRLHPELATGRNARTTELAPGYEHHVAWLDPDEPRSFDVLEAVLAEVARIFTGPHVHLGGDEPFGMPPELYRPFVAGARAMVRALGKVPIGWQESARVGLAAGDVVQHWIDPAVTGSAASLNALPEGARRLVEEITAGAATDLDSATAAGARLLLSPTSHCYLDTRYAGEVADAEHEARRRRLGLPFYPRRSVAAFWDWDPAAPASLAGVDGWDPAVHLAGVSAALWSETIGDFDDAAFLLLPRLPGIAERAWRAGRPRRWADHRRRLAAHAPMWDALGLCWFPTSEVDWSGSLAS